jgi:hypothetical protein
MNRVPNEAMFTNAKDSTTCACLVALSANRTPHGEGWFRVDRRSQAYLNLEDFRIEQLEQHTPSTEPDDCPPHIR